MASGTNSMSKPVVAVALGKLGSMSNARFKQSLDVQTDGCVALANVDIRTSGEAKKLLSAGAFDAIVTALRRFAGNVRLQAEGILALAHLAVCIVNTTGGRQRILKAGVCEAVAAGLVNFPDQQAIQAAGCRAAAALATIGAPGEFVWRRAHSAGELEADAIAEREIREKLIDCGVCRALVSALCTYTEDEQMRRDGLRAMCNFATRHSTATEQLLEASASDIVCTSLRAARSEHDLQRDGCVILACLSCNAEVQLGHLVKAGIAHVVCAAMCSIPEDLVVQRCGLTIVQELLKRLGEECCEVLLAAGVGHALPAAIRTSLEDIDMQRAGCCAISILSRFLNEDANRTLVEAGALEANLTAMWTHALDRDLQRGAASALRSIVSKDSSAAKRLADAGAALVLNRVMVVPSNMELATQTDCCAVLDVICRIDNESAKQAIEGGTCEAVCSAMRNFHDDVELQGVGTSVIACLVEKNGGWDRLAKAGAQEAVLLAMRAFSADAQTQSKGCTAVLGFLRGSLSEGSAGASLLMETGAGTAIILAMRGFPTDSIIQRDGCRTIALLTDHGNLEGQRRFVDESARVIAAAMLAVPDYSVQLAGNSAIVSLCNINLIEGTKRASFDGQGFLLEAGVCEYVVESLAAFESDYDLQLEGCQAALCLARDSRFGQQLLNEAGASDVVLAAMRMFDLDCELQSVCCGILAAISGAHVVPDVRSCLIDGEACELVVSALHRFPDFGLEAQRSGCEAIMNLTYCEGGPFRLVQAGGNSALQACMRTFPNDHWLQSCGSVALVCLLQAAGEDLGQDCTLACEVIFAAARQFPEDRSLRLSCCQLSTYLGGASQMDDVAAAMCWAVLSAMMDLPHDRDVQYYGCWAALLHARRGVKSRRCWVEAGACEAALVAFKQFQADAEVQWAACSALTTMALGDDEGRRRLMAAGASGAVLAAMRRLPWRAEAPECAASGWEPVI